MSSWPADLIPVGAPGWEQKASAWLLDRCPSEFRTYEIFRTHPAALGYVATFQLEHQVEAIRDAYRSARTTAQLAPKALSELLTTLEHEGARLALELSSAKAVIEALSVIKS
ncbi:MAG: hypothetical protein ACO3GT_02745 [Candidatus Nanopelagicales bacterium]